MTYTDRYNAIIHYFQRHPVDKKQLCCETHHILPYSCGGSNEKSNLVNLPTIWHYRVHCYLPFVMLEKNDEIGYRKMIYAWNRMQNSRKDFRDSLKTINEDSRLYNDLKQRSLLIIGESTSISQTGNKNSNYNHHWWKDPNDKTKSLSIKEGDPVPEGWIPGHWHACNDIVRQKAALASKNKILINNGRDQKYINKTEEIPNGWTIGKIESMSIETREKLSISSKNYAKKHFEELKQKWIPILLPMLDCYFSEGFDVMKEKFKYPYTANAICNQFRKYLPEEYNARKSPGKKHGK